MSDYWKSWYRRSRERIVAARDAARRGDVAAFDTVIVLLTDGQRDNLRYWCARQGVRWPA